MMISLGTSEDPVHFLFLSRASATSIPSGGEGIVIEFRGWTRRDAQASRTGLGEHHELP